MSRAPTQLDDVPVTLFAAVMGIGGLSLAWRRAAVVWSWPTWPAEALFWIATVVFVVVSVVYVTKWVRYPAAARAELSHPIRMAFVPTITIALLVLATAGQDLLPDVARVAWWLGAVGHLALTVVLLSAWFARPDIGLTQLTPAWFIPIVGNVVTPLAAAELGSTDLAWISFGVGLVFWLALLPLLLFRLLLHEAPLPPELTPTLAIFTAPPAVIGLAWIALGGTPAQPMSRVLYAATLAFLLLLVAQVPTLARLAFRLPWWAYTFPLAAAAASSLVTAGGLPGVGYDVVAGVLLTLATLVVALVTALTLLALVRGDLFHHEPSPLRRSA